MKISLPSSGGNVEEYRLEGTPVETACVPPDSPRIAFAAAHVVADPLAPGDPSGTAAIDWEATLRFRRHLDELGLGIAEAMDTAQRGGGLDWPRALELVKRTRAELPDAQVVNGCGTDQVEPSDARNVDDARAAYLEQASAIQEAGGRIVLMASRALARVASSPRDYAKVYRDVIAACDQPVILHWLGEMFDPALTGYWGAADADEAMENALEVIGENASRIDGIKISLLDKDREVAMRRRLPEGVRMYTGDDFNYPELILGDDQGHSDALLGIFDPAAPAAAKAISLLGDGDETGFRAVLDPTVPLAREMFRAPTRHYKSGVVFLAWLNGFQDHFVMLGGAQSMRSLPHFAECFRLADRAGLLRDPDLAVRRMESLLAIYGVGE